MKTIHIIFIIALFIIPQAKTMEVPKSELKDIEIVNVVDVWILAQVSEGYDLNDDVKGFTPSGLKGNLLEISVQGANLNTVESLLNAGAKITAESLSYAANRGHRGMLKLLIKRLEDREYLQIAFNKANWDKNFGCLEEMLENGVDIEANLKSGKLLEIAACEDNIDMVERLLNAGAKVTVGSMSAAAVKGHRVMLKLLISRLEDKSYLQSCLYHAPWSREYDCIEELLENGVDINACPKGGWTVLYTASANGNLPLIKFLIDRGADVNTPNGMGRNPLDVAITNYNLTKDKGISPAKENAIIEELKKHGAQVSKKKRFELMKKKYLLK